MTVCLFPFFYGLEQLPMLELQVFQDGSQAQRREESQRAQDEDYADEEHGE
jgi:hypothetical protein